MSAASTVLFVCTGNTCRSPLAEGLLRHALDGNPRWEASSAGISAIEGAAASGHTLSLLKEIGVDLGSHRARQLDDELLDHSRLVLCLADHHRRAILAHRPDAEAKVHLVLDFAPGLEGHDIPDPVGGPRAEYEEVRDALVETLPSLLAHLDQLADNSSPDQ